MSEFSASRDIKSTKVSHICEQCGNTIYAGLPARYHSGKHDGYFYSNYSHIECHAAAKEYAELNDMWGEDWPWFQYMDGYEFEHHTWLLENHPIVAERLGLKAIGE